MGQAESVSNHMEVEWKPVQGTNGTGPGGREGAAGVASGTDGTVVICGGAPAPDGSLDVWRLDVSTGAWTNATPAATVSGGPCAPLVGAAAAMEPGPDGRVWLFGGLDPDSGWSNEVWVLDGKEGWVQAQPSQGSGATQGPSPRDKASAFVHDGHLYVFGGFGPLPGADDETGSGDEDERGPAASFTWFGDLWRLPLATPGSAQWELVHAGAPPQECDGTVSEDQATCPGPRAAHSAVVCGDTLYVFGGRTSVGRTNDLWSLCLSAPQSWRRLSPVGVIPSARSFHNAVAVSPSRFLVFGGMSSDNKHFADVHVYDTKMQAWAQPQQQKAVPTPRGSAVAAMVSPDTVVVWGGSTAFSAEAPSLRDDVWTLPGSGDGDNQSQS